MRKTLFTSYALVVAAMAGATFAEQCMGTEYAASHIYGAPWFVALWAVLAVVSSAYLLRRRRRLTVVALHAAFVVILAGAALTHFTGRHGYVYLRQGETTHTYMRTHRGNDISSELPFGLRLDRFDVHYHDGTHTPENYSSVVTIYDRGNETQATISMNNIHVQRSVRLYQGNYDSDLRGSVLAVNIDPWGIAVTYAGYLMLLVAFIASLISPKGAFRQAMRALASTQATLPNAACGPTDRHHSAADDGNATRHVNAHGKGAKRGALMATLLMVAMPMLGAPTVGRDAAERLGQLLIVHNGRVCPLQTFAIDFTKKLYGKSTYRGYTAEQVLCGVIFWPEQWAGEEIVKVRGGRLRSQLQWPRHVSMHTLFNPHMGGYVLMPYVERYHAGHRDKFHKQAMELDEQVFMVLEARAGTLLRLYPQTVDGHTQWFGYDPHSKYPPTMRAATLDFMRRTSTQLRMAAQSGDMAAFHSAIDQIAQWQQGNGGASLPSAAQIRAEGAYNAVPWATVLFVACLAVALMALLMEIVALATGAGATGRMAHGLRAMATLAKGTLATAFAALSACIGLRWVAAGRIPLSNGYETMLFVAWAIMLVAMVAMAAWRRQRHEHTAALSPRRLVAPLALLMAGLFLLVSHISTIDPQIADVTPVLHSPLLTVHVSTIMLAFAMLSLVFVCGVVGLVVEWTGMRKGQGSLPSLQLALMGQALLHPALALLAGGIFIGAVWANVSWGRYWSWDAKETWALITMMVYAIGAHRSMLPSLRRPICWHVFATMAFATLAMTYFGVNYLLGSGLHTYA